VSLAMKVAMEGEQVGRLLRARRARRLPRRALRVPRVPRSLLRRAMGAVAAPVVIRRRRRRGITATELRGFRKVIRLLANFTGLAPQRLARRVRPPRRRW